MMKKLRASIKLIAFLYSIALGCGDPSINTYAELNAKLSVMYIVRDNKKAEKISQFLESDEF